MMHLVRKWRRGWRPLWCYPIWRGWAVTREQGDRLPPWWYAVGRVDFLTNEIWFYPLPLALLVRLRDAVAWRWNRWRSTPTALQRRVFRLKRHAEKRGYDRGYAAGYEAAHRTDLALLDAAARRLAEMEDRRG